jgi:hypothetical protein
LGGAVYVNGLPQMIDAQRCQSHLPEVEIFTNQAGLPPLECSLEDSVSDRKLIGGFG